MRVAIVDDEELGRRAIRARLATIPDVEIVAECSTPAEAVRAIESRTPDLVFLDIHMPDGSGFDVLHRLPDRALPFVVFVTAYDRYALEAFDAHALDYLLKPIDDRRFAATIDRARLLCTGQRLAEMERGIRTLLEHLERQHAAPRYRSHMSVRMRKRVTIVPVSDIDWVSATRDYVTLHVGSREHLVRQTIASLENQLDPEQFVRIHRSVIVQISRISELVTAQNGDFLVTLRTGVQLRASRTYSDRLDRWF
jgi:two-component system, LytTR family, response regulator